VPRDGHEEGTYLCMVTRKGIIKRSESILYNNVRKSGVIAINLDDDDELAWVRVTGGNDKLVVATRKGMSICFDENDARPIGRTARGVKAIELKEGDEVVGMSVVEEGKTLLTVSETGYGRRSDFDNYRVQSRGGKGLINYHTETYGDVAAIAEVGEDDDLILIASDGIIIRIAADGISTFARPSKGVKVMRVSEGEKLVTLTTAQREEAEETEEAPAAEENAEAESASETEPAETNETAE
ncbi:MAG: DNA gyrase subunit A, partial [Clostridia bacterium]|nr:DNA gyrase subunit A [Clostridia bacterium]